MDLLLELVGITPKRTVQLTHQRFYKVCQRSSNIRLFARRLSTTVEIPLEGPTAPDFASLGIRLPICQALKENFCITKPTLCQQESIPPILNGNDVFIRDVTGSGKTFGLTLALLNSKRAHRIDKGKKGQPCITSLLVVPSREVAMQIEGWVRRLLPSETFPSLAAVVQTVYRGQDINNNELLKSLSETPPHLLVGTATRLHELIKGRDIDLRDLRTLSLDEADHLLQLPKKYATLQEIYARSKHIPPGEEVLHHVFEVAGSLQYKPQLVVLSATVNRSLRYFFMKDNGYAVDPVFVDISKGHKAPDSIVHHCLIVGAQDIRNIRMEKTSWITENQTPENDTSYDANDEIDFGDDDDRMLDSVAGAFEAEQVERGILFIGDGTNIPHLISRLRSFGLPATELVSSFSSLAGGFSPSPNRRVLYVATQSFTRGVDIPSVSHVFILGGPPAPWNYLHMAGRTGRMGRPGKVIILLRNHGGKEAKMRTILQLMNANWKPFEHVQD
ncbi:11455_t:CDS:2 [Paraglomus brasilianum]|uniref:11455_t:CDS:1 n=1 Tax=Paraglomus brasilianum TaxID=144538 RepID=A0A9N9BY38_9GLOM|nr:11455_t:CDS:2 [Paraglomus brasilianum]